MPRTKLAGVSVSQLKAELARRRKAVPRLDRKRAKLRKALAAVDRQIAELTGEKVARRGAGVRAKVAAKPRRGRRGRKAPRPGSLKALLIAAMAGRKSLSVGEALQAVLDAGYKTQSKNFRLLVNQTLLSEPEFRKVRRGRYTVK